MTSDFILVKEHGCMYVLMNGANSDNTVSIQKKVTPNMLGRNMVTPNIVAWNLVTLNMVAWNLVTSNMVARNLGTLNMATSNLLGTRLHRSGVQRWWSAT